MLELGIWNEGLFWITAEMLYLVAVQLQKQDTKVIAIHQFSRFVRKLALIVMAKCSWLVSGE